MQRKDRSARHDFKPLSSSIEARSRPNYEIDKRDEERMRDMDDKFIMHLAQTKLDGLWPDFAYPNGRPEFGLVG